MPTPAELLHVLLLPLVVSAIIAFVGRLLKWAWAIPLAAGAGFLAGYATIGVPKFPPADGTDWLFWLTFPLVVLGIVDAFVGKFWGWVLGVAAGGVAWVIARPLVGNGAVSLSTVMPIVLGLAAAGVAIAFVCRLVDKRLAAGMDGVALAIVVGGAAVVVMSSNLRVVGLYGIAAAAALGPAGLLARDGMRGLPIVAGGLLAGLLTGGRLYADPGVTDVNFIVLAAAPLLLLPAAFVPLPLVPGKRWVRGLIAVLLVAIAVAAVAGPTAVAAKKAAEEDPYGGYK